VTNKEAIKIIGELEEEAFILVLTKEDAETYYDCGVVMTDEEWKISINELNRWFMGESEWVNFVECLDYRYKDRVSKVLKDQLDEN
jgi:hypothetical protein